MISFTDDEIEAIADVLQSRIRYKFRRWCLRLGWSEDDIKDWAESVTGEGIARELLDLENWDENRGEISWWFYLKVRAMAKDELVALEAEKRGLTRIARQEEMSEQIYDPSTRDNHLDLLLDALEPLTTVQREVFLYYEYVGMKVPEIGLHLGCPVKTVYTHLSRAKKRAQKNHGIGDEDSQQEVAPPHEARPPPSGEQQK